MNTNSMFTLVYSGPYPREAPPAGGQVVPQAEEADTKAANPWRVYSSTMSPARGIPVQLEPDLKDCGTSAILFGGTLYVSPNEYANLGHFGLDPNGLDTHLRQTCCLDLDAALSEGVQVQVTDAGGLSDVYDILGGEKPQYKRTIAETVRSAMNRRLNPTRNPNKT